MDERSYMKKETKSLNCENCLSKDKGIFCSLEHEGLEEVSKHKVTNTYKRGQTLFHEGNPAFGLYCVNKGKVKVTRMGSDGKESIVRLASEGDIIGHRSLFSCESYQASATALEDCTICFLDKKFILQAIEDEPSVALNIITQLSQEMGSAEARSAAMFQKNVRERLAELLLTFKISYGIKEGKRTRLDIKLTREEIASMIGTANETVIRFISEFKDEGILEQEGKVIYIIDDAKLMEFANINY